MDLRDATAFRQEERLAPDSITGFLSVASMLPAAPQEAFVVPGAFVAGSEETQLLPLTRRLVPVPILSVIVLVRYFRPRLRDISDRKRFVCNVSDRLRAFLQPQLPHEPTEVKPGAVEQFLLDIERFSLNHVCITISDRKADSDREDTSSGAAASNDGPPL